MTTAVDILAFGAHPDDVEIGMSGTIAKHIHAGHRVAICDLTEAEMSSNGTVASRWQEGAAAAAVLGLSARTCLGLPDRGLMMSEEHIQAIVREIRTFKPRIVFAPYWEDRHPDHNACSRLVEEAVFNAKLRRYMPELPPVQIEQLIFYYINDVKDVAVMVDISLHYEQKRQALQAFRSQFEAPDSTKDIVATPLNKGYLTNVEARDRLLGGQRGWDYAEGFALKKPHAVTLF
ncbi:bacillithiol biosynthesis deacetylase BshB1 [Paenibacillaceae bacterium]|nr:bacillithiol biosynthesis deacetylase BshB1 [Paenibacillaceae bacterium]